MKPPFPRLRHGLRRPRLPHDPGLTSVLAAAAGAPGLHSHPVLGKGSTLLPGLALPRQQRLRPLGLQQPPDLLRSEALHLFRMWNLKDRPLLPLFQGPAELPREQESEPED